MPILKTRLHELRKERNMQQAELVLEPDAAYHGGAAEKNAEHR